MITLFTAAQLYARIQQWIDGKDRGLTLKQLDNLAQQIEAMLIWADDIADIENDRIRKLFDKLDIQRDVILHIVGQEVGA